MFELLEIVFGRIFIVPILIFALWKNGSLGPLIKAMK